MEAKNPKLRKVGSHSVSAQSSWDVEREECYPYMTAQWRGDVLNVSLEATRYRFADGDWSGWRVFVRDARKLDGTDYGPPVNLTDAMRRALNDACGPLVDVWLDDNYHAGLFGDIPTYAESRQRAFRWLIVNQLRESRGAYDTKAHHIFTHHRHELTTADSERLSEAFAAQARFFDLIDFTEADKTAAEPITATIERARLAQERTARRMAGVSPHDVASEND